MLRYSRCVAFAAAVFIAGGLADAHEGQDEHGEEAGRRLLDCERLPANAIASLPQPVAAWTRLACRQTGQLLVESAEWQWRYPASFTTRVIVTAGMASPQAVGAHYFTSATVAVRDGAAAAQLHDQLSRDVSVYADNAGPSAPGSAYTLVASNDLGDQLQVHFLPRGGGDFLGVVCAPGCAPESTFIVQKRGG